LREQEGVTVFMTTHYMDEAEQADRIAIIDHGRIVAMGTPSGLKAAVGMDTVELATDDDGAAAENLAAAGFQVTRTSRRVVIRVADGAAAVPTIIATVGVPVRLVEVHRPTLDDVFLHFTGREIRDETVEPGTDISRAFAAMHRRMR
jgi:ABC-2 type transport system ATP-binding protein